jgi:hypothetical protein
MNKKKYQEALAAASEFNATVTQLRTENENLRTGNDALSEQLRQATRIIAHLSDQEISLKRQLEGARSLFAGVAAKRDELEFEADRLRLKVRHLREHGDYDVAECDTCVKELVKIGAAVMEKRENPSVMAGPEDPRFPKGRPDFVVSFSKQRLTNDTIGDAVTAAFDHGAALLNPNAIRA